MFQAHSRRLLCGCALYMAATITAAVELQPFEWHYDVVYQQKKRAYNGRGAYKLARKENDIWTFSLSVHTHNRIFSSVSEVLLYPDAQKVVVPLESESRSSFLGIPRNKKIELDLENENPYEALSVVLRLLYDLQSQDPIPEQWELWLADEKKYQQFVLLREEPLYNAGKRVRCYLIEKTETKPDRSLHIWIAKEENYIVKMIRKYKGTSLKMEASNYYDKGISI